jgi:methylene-fatty-acyl-phospholipid synthase
MDTLTSFVNFQSPSFWWCIGAVIWNPLTWNIIARLEYTTHLLTKLSFNNKYVGCYILATYIFLMGLYREHTFVEALVDQPKLDLLGHPVFVALSAVLFVFGSVLVAASYYRLGITGTYLGDYFGILMDEKVTGFPFNFMHNPMYNGSSIIFLAHALWERSVAGVVLAGVVYVVYRIAILFEEPFTGYIYAQRDKRRLASKVKKIQKLQ